MCNYQSMDNTLILIQAHTRIATTPHYAVASHLYRTTSNNVESTNDNSKWYSKYVALNVCAHSLRCFADFADLDLATTVENEIEKTEIKMCQNDCAICSSVAMSALYWNRTSTKSTCLKRGSEEWSTSPLKLNVKSRKIYFAISSQPNRLNLYKLLENSSVTLCENMKRTLLKLLIIN